MSNLKTQNIRSSSQGSFRTVFQNASYDQLWVQIVLTALPPFPKKRFQLRHSKICKKVKNVILNAQNIPCGLKVPLKLFPKTLPIANQVILKVCILFPENCFNFMSTNCQIVKTVILKRLLQLPLTSTSLQNRFP